MRCAEGTCCKHDNVCCVCGKYTLPATAPKKWRVEFWASNNVWQRSTSYPDTYTYTEALRNADELRRLGLKHVRAVFGFASIVEPPADAVETPVTKSPSVFILTRTQGLYIGVFKSRECAEQWLGHELLLGNIDLEIGGNFALTESTVNNCGFKVTP